MKKLVFLIALNFLLFSCKGQNVEPFKTLDAKAYSEKLSATEKAQFLDVRTPAEYSEEHIGDAVNVNWNGSDFEQKAATYDKSKPIFVYCKSGGRSAQAAYKLQNMGFKEVYNLDGGIMKWNSSGLAPKSDEPKKIIGICSQEYADLIKSNDKIIVNFNAKWCAPCQKMKPYLLKMQEELKGKTTLVRLDADENKTILEDLKLDGLPVILIYENGKETFRNIGYMSEEDLRKHI